MGTAVQTPLFIDRCFKIKLEERIKDAVI